MKFGIVECMILGASGGVLGAALEMQFGPIAIFFFAIALVVCLLIGENLKTRQK